VHLDDLLRNGETEPGPALGLGVRAVYLVELLKYAGLVLFGNARPCVCDGDGEVAVAVGGRRADTYLSGVRELDGRSRMLVLWGRG
jgi:hypothetical protein